VPSLHICIEMQYLPNEVQLAILKRAGAVARPILRCVSPLWRSLLSERRHRKGPCRGKGTRCLLQHECATKYACRLAAGRMWTLLDWMPRDLITGKRLAQALCRAAIEDNDMGVLRTNIDHVGQNDRHDLGMHAISYGHLQAVQLAFGPDHKPPTSECASAVFYKAAKRGHWHVLAWLERRFPMPDTSATCGAAKGGHLEMLKEMHQRGYAFDDHVVTHAVRANRLDIVEWLTSVGYRWCRYASITASYHGHLTLLKWAHANGCMKDDEVDVVEGAARGGHIDILVWLSENGYQHRGARAAEDAARGGHLCVLQWMEQNDWQRDTRACKGAAEGGHLHILEWLYDHGHRWDNEAYKDAMINGHVHVLNWLEKHGGRKEPLHVYSMLQTIAARGHLSVLRWIRKRAPGMSLSPIGSMAAAKGRIDMLDWARRKGCKWHSGMCYNAVVCCGDLDVVRWLVEHGCPWDERVSTCASSKPDILNWLHERERIHEYNWLGPRLDGNHPRKQQI